MSIRDLGEHRLKDMKYPTSIYQLIVEGLPSDFAPLRTKFSGTEMPTPGEAPFKGLQFFDVDDSDLFFGREVLTAKLIDHLHAANFLSVIIGASGSGKSSLVRAGLVPTLKKASVHWQVHIITPTTHPLEALAIELTRDSESVTAAATLMDDLSKDPRSLHFFLSRQAQIHNSSHTLLVIDQFEELFTLCRDEFEREAFIDNLLTALTPTPLPLGEERKSESKITLVITLRADFYVHLAQYPELRDQVAQQQEYIGPMTIEELRRAIEEPAHRGHWEFEAGLVDLILRDAGDEPGALPLLSHALLETWKRRAGHVLTLKGYADAGGVRGAIAHTAESVYQSLQPKEQSIMRNILLRLTEFGEGTEDTRRRASFNELMSSAEDADEVRIVLNKMAEARLVTLSEDTAEVSHEALIREWPQLREWLSQDREEIILHRRLTEAAQEWELLERDADILYRGARLAQTQEWASLHSTALNTVEKAFLDSSYNLEQSEIAEREAQRQRELEAAQKLAETERARAEEQIQSSNRLRLRNRIITSIGVVALILAILAGVFALSSNQNAQKAQTNFTHADALRLAAEANKLLLQPGSDANLATLLSLRSMNTQYTPQGDQALEGAMTRPFPHLVFNGHTDDISDAAYSPDGKYIATSSMDKTVRLWDAQTGKEVRQFIGHSDGVMGVAFSPDGKYIATASLDQTLRLWDARTGKTLRTFTYSTVIFFVAFSPDGKDILFSGYSGTTNLLDVQTFQVMRTYTQQGIVYCQGFSYDGKYLLTGNKLKAAHLWDVQTGKELHQFSLPVSVRQCTFSPDEKTILTAGEDNIIRMWDINTGQQVRTFVGHTGELGQLTFSPDGKYILSAGDGTARLWNSQTGEQIRVLTVPLGTATIPTMGATFSPDGKYIFTAQTKTGLLWDMASVLNTGLPQFITPNDAVYRVDWSRDGKYILTASATHNLARLWDVQTRQDIQDFCCHADYVWSVVFSPDGKYVLTGAGNGDNTVRLWDRQTDKELLRFEGTTDDYGLAGIFSPDGKYIVTNSNYVVLRDAKTGQQIRSFVGHTDRVVALAFSPDGRDLLTGSWDSTVRLWDVQTGEQLKIFTHPTGDQVNAVAYSPDGKFILTGGGDHLLRLWDVETGKEVREFSGHTDGIGFVVFLPDGKYALSGAGDARLWDVTTGTELRRFVMSVDAVEGIAFSPDGKYVLTGDDGGVARVWFTDYRDEIQYLCARLPRDFTDAERKEFNITDNTPTCPKP